MNLAVATEKEDDSNNGPKHQSIENNQSFFNRLWSRFPSSKSPGSSKNPGITDTEESNPAAENDSKEESNLDNECDSKEESSPDNESDSKEILPNGFRKNPIKFEDNGKEHRTK